MKKLSVNCFLTHIESFVVFCSPVISSKGMLQEKLFPGPDHDIGRSVDYPKAVALARLAFLTGRQCGFEISVLDLGTLPNEDEKEVRIF